MTRATVAKLAVLIFLAFIVCLPEFFTSEKAVHLQFLCSPFDPCDPPNGLNPYDGQIYEAYYNDSRTPPLCETKPENVTSQDWYVCQTQADLHSLHDNASISGVDVEVTLTLQTTNVSLQNFTLQGHFNFTGLHIETQHTITLLSCCNNTMQQPSEGLSKSNTSDSATHSTNETSRQDSASNRSQCFLHFSDISKTPENAARWWNASAVVWFVLVLVMTLLVLISIGLRVKCYQKKPVVISEPVYQATLSKRTVKSLGDLPDAISTFDTEELFLERIPPNHSREKFLQVFQEPYMRGLSPIHEVSMTDVLLDEDKEEEEEEEEEEGDNEERFDDTVTDEGSEVSLEIPLTPANSHFEPFTFLHHRGHPSTAS